MWRLGLGYCITFLTYYCVNSKSDDSCSISLMNGAQIKSLGIKTTNRQGADHSTQTDGEKVEITCPGRTRIEGYYRNQMGQLENFRSSSYVLDKRTLELTCQCSQKLKNDKNCHFQPKNVYISRSAFEHLVYKEKSDIADSKLYFPPVIQVYDVTCQSLEKTESKSTCLVQVETWSGIKIYSAEGKEEKVTNVYRSDVNGAEVELKCQTSILLDGSRKYKDGAIQRFRRLWFYEPKLKLKCLCEDKICKFKAAQRMSMGPITDRMATVDPHVNNDEITQISKIMCLNRGLDGYNSAKLPSRFTDPKRYFVLDPDARYAMLQVKCATDKMAVNGKLYTVKDGKLDMTCRCSKEDKENKNCRFTPLSNDVKESLLSKVLCEKMWDTVMINPFKEEPLNYFDGKIEPDCQGGKCRFADKNAKCFIELDSKIYAHSDDNLMRATFADADKWELGKKENVQIDLVCPEGRPFIVDGKSKKSKFSKADHSYRTLQLICKCESSKCKFVPNVLEKRSNLVWRESSKSIEYVSINGHDVTDISKAVCGSKNKFKLQAGCNLEYRGGHVQLINQNPFFKNEESVQVFGGRANMFLSSVNGHMVTAVCGENMRIKMTGSRQFSDGTLEYSSDLVLRQAAKRGQNFVTMQLICKCDPLDQYKKGCSFEAFDKKALRLSIWPVEKLVEFRNSANNLIQRIEKVGCVPETKEHEKYGKIEYAENRRFCGISLANGATTRSKTKNSAVALMAGTSPSDFFATSANKAQVTVLCAAVNGKPNSLLLTARFQQKLGRGKGVKHTRARDVHLSKSSITLTCACNPKRGNCVFKAPANKYRKRNTKRTPAVMTDVNHIYCHDHLMKTQ